MATVGAAKSAHTGSVHDLGAAGDGGDRHAAAERLRHGNQIGLDAEMFGSEPFAGAGEAGLHFIGNEENAVLAADILQELEIIVRRNDEAAFAKNGFGDDGSDGFGSDGTFEGIFEMMRESLGRSAFLSAIGISKRNAVDVAGER